MPGLIRGVARTAVVAGTATAVSGRVARRQAENMAERDQAIAANRAQGYARGYESAAPQVDVVAQLKQLAELKDQGILTDEEFAAQKARLLGG